jgi:hypothetical protein
MAQSNTNLSLGKLRRAVDGNDSYTAQSLLGATCAGGTTSNSDYAIGDFSIDSTDSVSGFAYVDEQTSETYTLNFTNNGSRFLSRIAGNSFNFTWTTNNALFAKESSPDYTAVYSAGAISNINVANTSGDGVRGTFHAAHTNDTALSISGLYNDDGQINGFNDHSSNYNSAFAKAVQVEDTYNSTAITCFLPDTPIELENGEILPIEDLVVGDKIKSFHIDKLPDESLGVERYRGFHLEDTNGDMGETTVKNVWFDFNPGYLIINDGLLKVTSEHEFWVLNKTAEPVGEFMPPVGKWGFKRAAALKVGDVMFGKDGEIEINSIEYVHKEVEVVNINVEPVDVYFINGILVHNKGNNTAH